MINQLKPAISLDFKSSSISPKKGEKDKFIKKWKELEETCEKIFKPQQGTPMDELFTRYMYYERAKQGNKSLLEKRINIRASDYRFEDKITYYKGFTNSIQSAIFTFQSAKIAL